MTEQERIQWEAERLAYFAPDPNPEREAALVKVHLAFRELAMRPTAKNNRRMLEAFAELDAILGVILE